MKDAVYTFIFVLFVLMQLGAWFFFTKKITADVNKIKKSGDISEREDKLLRLYQMMEEMMDAFEEYVEESRKGIEEERGKLDRMNAALEGEYQALSEKIGSLERELQMGTKEREEFFPLAGVHAETGRISTENLAQAPLERIKMPTAAAAESYSRSAAGAELPLTDFAEPEQEEWDDSRLSENEMKALSKLSTKTQKVRFLAGIGFRNEEIAKELSIGNGEVRLIMNIGGRPETMAENIVVAKS